MNNEIILHLMSKLSRGLIYHTKHSSHYKILSKILGYIHNSNNSIIVIIIHNSIHLFIAQNRYTFVK